MNLPIKIKNILFRNILIMACPKPRRQGSGYALQSFCGGRQKGFPRPNGFIRAGVPIPHVMNIRTPA